MAELFINPINHEYKWYAIYTRLNHEKTVETTLIDQKIKVYLPKKKTLRKWSDRMKWIEEPLFRPYVFVNVSNREYYRVLQVPSVLFYISFEGRAVPIPDYQIELIKKVIDNDLSYEVSRHHFKLKQKAVVKRGPFIGQKVEVVNHKANSRLLVSIDQLNCSMLVEIDANYLKLL